MKKFKEGDKVRVTLNNDHHWLAPGGEQLVLVKENTFEGFLSVIGQDEGWFGVDVFCVSGDPGYVHISTDDGDSLEII